MAKDFKKLMVHLEELRKNMTEAELIYWAAYYEVKTDEEKKAYQRQKHNSR